VGVALAGGLAGGTYLAHDVEKIDDGRAFRHGETIFSKHTDGGMLIGKKESLRDAMKSGKWQAAMAVDPHAAIDRIEHQRKNPKILAYKFNPDGTLDYFRKFSKDVSTGVDFLQTSEKFNTNGPLLEGRHESDHFLVDSAKSKQAAGTDLSIYRKKTPKASNPTDKPLFSQTVFLPEAKGLTPYERKGLKITEDTLKGNEFKGFKEEMANLMIPLKGGDFVVEPFANSAEDRLRDLPKGLPTKFADVEGYLKNVQLKNTGIALAVGAALGGLAYLGITQVGKKPKVEPTSYPLKDGASPTA
jgi:hypothetical protein